MIDRNESRLIAQESKNRVARVPHTSHIPGESTKPGRRVVRTTATSSRQR